MTKVNINDSSKEEPNNIESEMRGIKLFNPRNLTVELAENRISNHEQVLREMGQEGNKEKV